MTDREKCIGFGRIRPARGSDEAARWKEWSAIQRNIWLWRETNQLLAETRAKFPDRVTLLDFELLKVDPDLFWSRISSAFGLSAKEKINHHIPKKFRNRKPGGAQIGKSDTWSPEEREMLAVAKAEFQGFWDDGN